jgi:hypothetical protein
LRLEKNEQNRAKRAGIVRLTVDKSKETSESRKQRADCKE